MKRIVTLILALCLVSLTAMAQDGTGIHRNDGPVVDLIKENVAAYEAGDWETLKKNSAPDAQYYVNSTEPISLEANIKQTKEGVEGLESYAFENSVVAHVRTAEGVDWGMFWGNWVGQAGDETMSIMVHFVSRIVEGKVVEQYGFWDAVDPTPDMATNN